MLEELLPRWKGKVFVLVLLGFAFTDFIITITLSAADATAHIVENPFVPAAFHHQVGVTLVLLALLAAVFLKGFREAIGFAVVIVALYLAPERRPAASCSASRSCAIPSTSAHWRAGAVRASTTPLPRMIGLSLLLLSRSWPSASPGSRRGWR